MCIRDSFYTKEEEDELIQSNADSNHGRYSFPGGIPAVHVRVTNEKHTDFFFHAHKAYVCPLVKTIQNKIKETDFFRNYSKAVLTEIGEQIVDILNKERAPLGVTNLTVDSLTLRKLKRIHDGYKVFAYHKYQVPPFQKKLLKKLHELQFFYVYHVKYGDHFIKRATVSLFFRELADMISGRLFNKTIPHKFLLYSAHDSNLEAFLSLLLTIEELRGSPDFLPPFGSILAVEIHRRAGRSGGNAEDYFVKFTFNKKELTVKHCNDSKECDLSWFLNFLEKNHLPNLIDLCHSQTVKHEPKIKRFTCPE
eukprot:TRINITY_DN4595_c0_g1_i2.p1 TRINITY_DN4595_c0_g1~~TRINITY_DN4595_c0_g1_i2.p1  ORF type:complete len:308 (+),score=75.62 TRINITY_DN4595_c0_g1_i2:65-988(+)